MEGQNDERRHGIASLHSRINLVQRVRELTYLSMREKTQ